MPIEVTMPRLSDTMSEGTVGRWLKKPGDQVEKGEIIAEIETDKATMELESFDSGTLQQIVIPEGKTVPIGEVIALIGNGTAEGVAASAPTSPTATTEAPPAQTSEEGGAVAAERTAPPASTAPQPGPGPAEGTPQAEAAQGTAAGYGYPTAVQEAAEPASTDGHISDDRVKASPVARRIAEELGVDLRLVQGTGPGGRIIKENVEEFYERTKGAQPAPAQAPAEAAPAPAPVQAPTPAPAPKAAPAPSQAPTPAAPSSEAASPMSRMRRAIARAMSVSKPGIPHIYVTTEIDMAAATQLRQQINDSGAAPVKISFNDMVVKAAAKALLKFPSINSSYATTPDGQPGIINNPRVNVSVAVALDDGLMAPVVADADKKSLGTISSEIKDMAGRAREGKIKQNELEGATFQVSNLGMFDVVEFVSIITAPQSASLSVGAVRQTPVVREGQIVIGEIMNVTISVDHRVVDGATAAQYLQELKRLLEAPMALLV